SPGEDVILTPAGELTHARRRVFEPAGCHPLQSVQPARLERLAPVPRASLVAQRPGVPVNAIFVCTVVNYAARFNCHPDPSGRRGDSAMRRAIIFLAFVVVLVGGAYILL